MNKMFPTVLFGIDITKESSPCSGRPGIVEIKDDDEPTGWRPFCYHLADDEGNPVGSPVTVGCEHEALGLVSKSIQLLMQSALEGGISKEDLRAALPHPTDLRYTYIDEEPEGLDAEVTTTADADAVLAKVMGGASC
jgi:hypothetical protein